MFTGIVTHRGTVRAVTGTAARDVVIEPGFDPATLAVGASVAHAGVCLTVTAIDGPFYEIHASPETLARSTLRTWAPGRTVNLERSLRLGDELGGHLVFGHVDAVGTVRALATRAGSWRLEIALDPPLAPMVAVKGSIAVDGVSLTVTEALADGFAVVIVPHTWEVTTLAGLRPGDPVNLEVDMLARYVARQLAFLPGAPS
jgi:riboflavin synthase